MLGFFSKLFKSKTPATETPTQPENTPSATDVAADGVTSESHAGQPENAVAEVAPAEAAAEQAVEKSAEQTAEQNAAPSKTEPAAQPDTAADETASVKTVEQETAAQRQPENDKTQPENAEAAHVAPENKTAAVETTELAVEPAVEQAVEPSAEQTTEQSTQTETATSESATVEAAASATAAQGQPETAANEAAEATQGQPETEPSAAQPNPNEPTVRNWTMTAVAEKPNSWASAAEKAQPKPAAAETATIGQPENVVSEATETDGAAQGQPENQSSAPSKQQPENAVSEAAEADVVAQGQPENQASKLSEQQPENAVSEAAEADGVTQGQSENVETEAQAKSEAATVGQPENVVSEAIETQPKLGWAARLKQGLTKSRNHMAKSLAGVFGGGQIDEDLYEELETVLLTSDMGIEATEQLMNEVRDRVSLKGLKDGNELRQALKDAVYDLLKPLEQPLAIPANGTPFVIMLAGINGAGKTTSIGKLAKYFQAQGKSVILAAGDTFRAAAREQLQEWGERNGVTVISQAKGDSAAVCFDAVEAAKARKIDIVLADTAGRLPTQLHLMEEIKKVKRVLQKSLPDAPHEIIVVLDANIGQNAVNQVVAFDDALGVTGLIVTKLDGTAKGGVLAALASSRTIPVRYIGVGESIDDLRPFNAKDFVDALLD